MAPRKPINPQAIRDRLSTALTVRRISQRELARRIGIREQAISKWLASGAFAGWVRLEQVCRAAKVSADELLGLEKPTAVTVRVVNVVGLTPDKRRQVTAHLEAARALLDGAGDSTAAEVEALVADAHALAERERAHARKRKTRPSAG